jgi:hypothetical protein
MNKSRTSAAIDAARPLNARRRRVKRGVIASYIHEISGRHADARSATSPDQEKPLVASPSPVTGS